MTKFALVLLVIPWWLLFVALASAQMGESFPGGYENAFTFAFIFLVGSFVASFLSVASGVYLFRGKIAGNKMRWFLLIAGIIPAIVVWAVFLILYMGWI